MHISGLTSLKLIGLPIDTLAPLPRFADLQSLDCSHCDVEDLSPLTGLYALQSLTCIYTKVSSLAPLAKLSALRTLNCSNTLIEDIEPLAELVGLEDLNIGRNLVSNLAPIAGSCALQRLACWVTEVRDLSPLRRLVKIASLDVSRCAIYDLAPLAGLTALQTLDCSLTRVVDLTPLASLTALQTLSIGGAPVADLAPLAKLSALRSLECWGTKVSDLGPLAGLPELKRLRTWSLELRGLDRGWIERGPLEELILYDTSIADIPAGVLSSDGDEDCLASLRAYFNDSTLDDGRLYDVKLMLLGNGRVGKTQLARALQDQSFEADSKSTHGVTVAQYDLPRGEEPPIPLHIWDFGGQDIYHGTHALFLSDHAIFALVWKRADAGDEQNDAYSTDRPLRYWVDYVHRVGGQRRAAVIVQTRCDAPGDGVSCPVPEADMRARFGRFWPVDFSAKTRDGLGELRAALSAAAAYAIKQQGAPMFPVAWARVKAALEAMRAEDQARPEAERRLRVVEASEFEALCRDQGVKSEPRHLLNYLHRSGVVFYRPELMDRIVLDQAWALAAIYAVFEREQGAYKRIRANRGRFTLADLSTTVWQGQGGEQRALFLDMMCACGVAFRLDRHGAEDETARYIAPELLPERAEVEADIRRDWDTDQPIRARRYRYAFLHDGLIRALISGIGDLAGPEAVYWRDGVTVYETNTGARARIEQIRKGDWSGEILVETRGGRAEDLLAQLCQRVERTQQQLGLEGKTDDPAPARAEAETPLKIDRRPDDRLRIYVSYALADDSDPTREQKVDETCAEAKKRGLTLIRDKDALKPGDSIKAFMERLGQGDRVYVFLSDKYLKSPFCMFELCEIWRRCEADEEKFKQRVRLFKLSDVQIRELEDRTAYAIYWDDKLTKMRGMLRDRDPIAVLGKRGAEEYARMLDFTHHVNDILDLFAKTLQPKTFEEFLDYGFEGLPAPAGARS
jgi:internalin A